MFGIINQLLSKLSVHNIGNIKANAAGRHIADKDGEVGVTSNLERHRPRPVGNSFHEAVASLVVDESDLDLRRGGSPGCIDGYFLTLDQILGIKSISLSAGKAARNTARLRQLSQSQYPHRMPYRLRCQWRG